MATAFAAQLRTIAENSSHELDLRARREAHAESLLFERGVAAKQDWDTIYQICVEGFQELCLLDPRLVEFNHNLFSPQAKDQDRDQLSRPQNDALAVVIKRCLALIGGKLLLRPGLKALEWLIRRFRVHIHDTSAILGTVLPYHESPVFRNILSIIPANKITNDWKLLGPYYKSAANVPRHAIVYSATHNDGFFSAFNNQVLYACQEGAGHTILLRFWSSMVVEAITGRLHQAKSGRKEVQKQRQEDLLLKVLPLLVEGFEIPDCAELTITCFTISIVLAGSADLEDSVIDSLMSAIASFLSTTQVDRSSVLTCLAILVAHKSQPRVPKEVLNLAMKAKNLSAELLELQPHIPVNDLLEALMASALIGLKMKNVETRLSFFRALLQNASTLLESTAISRLIAPLISQAHQSRASSAPNSVIGTKVNQLLRELGDSPSFKPAFTKAATISGKTVADVGDIIGGTIDIPEQSHLHDLGATDIDEEMAIEDSTESRVESALAILPHQSNERSFMSKGNPIFAQFAQAFEICCRQRTSLQRFQLLPIWHDQQLHPSHLYESFLLRFACGSFSAADRAIALHELSKRVEEYPPAMCQSLLPYLTVLLADPAQTVRQATSSTIVALQKLLFRESTQAGNEHVNEDENGHDALAIANAKNITARNVAKLVQQVYIPALEECILDFTYIRKVLETAFDSSAPSGSSGARLNMELKKSLRQNLFELLTSYAVACPLLRVKLATVEFLRVHKVGTSSTSKILSPILRDWSSLSELEANKLASQEGLSLGQLDAGLVQLINPQDKEAVERVLIMLGEEQVRPRPALVAAFFDRIGKIWKEMRPEAQISGSSRLFDMAYSDDVSLARGSRQVLHTVSLSTHVLATILDHACSGLTQMQPEGPPKKRRRTSQGRESMSKEFVIEFDAAVSRLTFALEITDSSKPEMHPELLGNLFDVLVTLRRLKDKSTSESPYLLSLCLSSILAIVDKARAARKPGIEMSSIRADLITECARSSDSPQVQATAILVAASLASLAPDRILHNIMPMFTFMGHSILSKDDERSIYVTNSAIDQIIPPLVSSLQKQDSRNLIGSTSSLLSSFVTAYPHVPQHRRVPFYLRLLRSLGQEEFSFAMVALLAISRQAAGDLPGFFTGLLGDLPAHIQLLTYRKIVGLSQDIFEANPHNAESLFNASSMASLEKERTATVLLETAASLLRSSELRSQARRIHKTDQTAANRFREEYKACVPQILTLLRAQKLNNQALLPSSRACLSALLELPSLADFLNTMPSLLQEMEQLDDTELQALALRVLATQLQHNAPKDSKTNTEAMAFLSTLESIISISDDETYRHAAISCLDRIVEVYGRKSPQSILRASNVLVDGRHGLDSENARTQVMSLLCLASMMEVLKEAAVPIIPPSMAKVLGILKKTVQGDVHNPELHNAAFALLSAFISHVSFMISDQNVVEILRLSCDSVRAELGASCSESRQETSSILAHKIDIGIVTPSLIRVFQSMVSESNIDADAIGECLEVLSKAIDRSTKAAVVKSAEAISKLLLHLLDVRRIIQMRRLTEAGNRGLSDEGISGIESRVHTIAVSFIYKLNDTTFRPVFESWVDWATKGSDLSDIEEYDSSRPRMARLTSLFNLLTHFFDTLKSIVTGYTSYILEPVNKVLEDMLAGVSKPGHSVTDEELAEYKSTLTLLNATLTHDADGFFASPSHFNPLCSNLVAQFTLLASSTKSRALRKMIEEHVPAALIALVQATIDTPSHHHALNHLLCQLRHNDAAGVRLAGIRLQIALTEDEDVGDEWVNNVVAGTATEGVGGSGETMVYVNESLEDDDEQVEAEVRRWVRLVREKVGEDIFEV